MEIISEAGVEFNSSAVGNGGSVAGIAVTNKYLFEAFDPEGNLKWREEISNLVTTEGLTDVINKYLKGNTYTAAWYLGLTDGTPTAASADTLASNAGWNEITPYTPTTRKTLTFGTPSGTTTVSVAATTVVYTITGGAITIGGAFICSVSSGTAGVLYSIAAFTEGNKGLNTNDTLNVTVTCSSTSA